MHRLLSIATLCLTLLVVQSSPAWGHRHESLSPEQLATHLQIYHADAPASETPQGWHVHRTSVQLIEPVCQCSAEFDATSYGGENSFDSPAHPPANAAVDRYRTAPLRQRSLFHVYQSLLL